MRIVGWIRSRNFLNGPMIILVSSCNLNSEMKSVMKLKRFKNYMFCITDRHIV